MKGKTLFVSDLDGTLFQPGATLSSRTVSLLNNAVENGKLFTIATARTPATVDPILKDVILPVPGVVMTGAAIWDKGTGRFSDQQYIPEEAVRGLIDGYHASGFPIFLFMLDDNVIDIYHIGGELSELERRFMEERLDSPYKRFHIAPDGSEILPDDLSRTILFYGMQPTAAARRADEATRNVTGSRVQLYHDLYGPEIALVDAFAAGATKASAISRLKKRTGAGKVVAFGDNLNDIPMLMAADVGVAVENALPEVKEIADIVIGPNTDDSVAKFIADADSEF